MAQNRNGGGRTVTAESIREGGRWLNAAPPSAEVAAWFNENVKLHEGLEHEDFIGGIVLIKSSDNIGTKATPVYRDIYTPYAKVDTRIDYFWKWCELRGYLGVIEKVKRRLGDGKEWSYLPDGFFPAPYMGEDGKWRYHLGCEVRVGVYETDLRAGGRGRAVIEPATGVKAVNWWKDPDLYAKVETGAVGRALGMAGMLVLGSGVATAEDILELPGHSADLDAELPPPAASPAQQGSADTSAADTSLEDQWAGLQQRLESDFPGLADDLQSWAEERKIDVTNVRPEQLRAVVKQTEKLIEKAEKDAAARS